MIWFNYSDPNESIEGKNTFWFAAERVDYELSLLLCDYGAGLDALCNEGISVLHSAYSNIQTRKDLFMFLLDAGESPNIKSLKSTSVQFEAIIIRDDDEVTEMFQDKYKDDIKDIQLLTMLN